MVLAVGLGAVLLAARAQVLDGLAVAAVMVAAAYGYGRWLASRLDLGLDLRAWRNFPLLAALGWTVLIMLGLAAGSAGALTRPVLIMVCLGGVAAAVLPTRPAPPATTAAAATREPGPLGWWGLSALLLVGLAGAVAPDVRYDALVVHLPIARDLASRHAITEIRHNLASYFPLNADLLYAMGMVLLPGEAVPKLLHFLAGALACLLVLDLGTRLWDGRVGLTAAAVVAGTPLVLWLSGTAYTDLWLVLFAVGAAAGFLLFLQRPGAPRALAVGLLVGALAGVKITGAIVAVPVMAAALLRVAVGRDLVRRWAVALATVAGAAATGAYWYARAWILTDNPVFPLLGPLLGGRYAQQGAGALTSERFGMGTAPWDVLLLPWRLTWFPDRFAENESLSIGVAFLILLPFALLAIARRRIPWWLAGLAAAGGVLWFYTAQYARFLVPVLPLAALIGAAGMFAAGLPARVVRASGAIAAAGVAFGVAVWVQAGPPNFPLPVLAGRATREEYATAHIPGFRMARYAVRRLPPAARIFGAGEDQGFHYERFFLPISWHGRILNEGLRRVILSASRGSEVRGALMEAGFTHLVIQPDRRWLVRRRARGSWIAREAFWEEGPRLEYAYGGFYLFDLFAPAPRGRGSELLANPGMAPGPEGIPLQWQSSGDVRAVPSQDPGALGASVRVPSGAYLVQQVAVEPGALYALEARIRAMTPAATARLFIQWIDGRGQPLDYTTWREVRVGGRLDRYAFACAAHPDAQAARVWLMAMQGDVEFGSAGFYELR